MGEGDRENGRQEKGEEAMLPPLKESDCKPGFVPSEDGGCHSSRDTVARAFKQPTREP